MVERLQQAHEEELRRANADVGKLRTRVQLLEQDLAEKERQRSSDDGGAATAPGAVTPVQPRQRPVPSRAPQHPLASPQHLIRKYMMGEEVAQSSTPGADASMVDSPLTTLFLSSDESSPEFPRARASRKGASAGNGARAAAGPAVVQPKQPKQPAVRANPKPRVAKAVTVPAGPVRPLGGDGSDTTDPPTRRRLDVSDVDGYSRHSASLSSTDDAMSLGRRRRRRPPTATLHASLELKRRQLRGAFSPVCLRC